MFVTANIFLHLLVSHGEISDFHAIHLPYMYFKFCTPCFRNKCEIHNLAEGILATIFESAANIVFNFFLCF